MLVIPGNHDNAKRFAAIERLSDAAGIHVVPEVRRPDAGGIVEIASRDGSQTAQVAALPWVPEKLLFGAERDDGARGGPEQRLRRRACAAAARRCARDFAPGKVHLLAGAPVRRAAPRSAAASGPLTIGDIFAVAPQGLPITPQYIALGHVHRPQAVTAAGVPTRYAGSLLQLDFGEREQEKSVVIVDARSRAARRRSRPSR